MGRRGEERVGCGPRRGVRRRRGGGERVGGERGWGRETALKRQGGGVDIG